MLAMTHVMKRTPRRGCRLCNLRSKGIRVSLKDLCDCLLSDALVFNVVAASIAVAVLAILPA